MTRVVILPQSVNQTRSDPEGDDGVAIFWPQLGLMAIDGLDYVTNEYSPAFLREAATALEATAKRAKFDHQLPLATAAVLRDLADNPDALEALNQHRRVVPAPIRALNIALHYLVAKELNGKAAAAVLHVATVWAMPEKTIMDMHGEHGAAAARELEKIVGRLISGKKFPKRRDVLAAIDADMQWRVPILAKFERYKTRQKRASRKK
jgi:hypothetical protein